MRAFNKLSVALATTFALVFATAALPAQASGPSGFAVGDGTAQSPYEVGTLAELANVTEFSEDGVYFKQTADLDLTGQEFVPIGTQSKNFHGTYDGAGHTVKGILADTAGEGLFGYVGNGSERSVIKNLNVEGEIARVGNDESGTGIVSANSFTTDFINVEVKMTGSVDGSTYIGAITGYSQDITITDSSVTGSLSVINGSSMVGGLVGGGPQISVIRAESDVDITGESADFVGGLVGNLSEESVITDSVSHGDIAVSGSVVGGAVGAAYYSIIEKTYATGNVTGGMAVGGLVGTGIELELSQVFATGVVTGQQRVGGVSGQLYRSSVHDAYSTGDVVSEYGVGLIVGYTEDTELIRTHGTGLVSGWSSGLIGDDDGGSSIADSFWFQELNEISHHRQFGNERSLTLVEAVDILNYSDAFWAIGADVVDVANVWTICAVFNDGIPFLSFAYPNACTQSQVLTPTPTISGGSAGNSLLTATPGTWDDGTSLTYTWYADDVEIADATSATYTPTLPQIGAHITVKVTSTKPHFFTVSKTSVAYGPIGSFEQTLKPVPVITGNATVGSTLTANSGTWDSGVTVAYQWLLNGVEISGANTASYTPTPIQAGERISVRVTGSKAGFVTASATSAQVGPIALGNITLKPVPTVSGTGRVGSTLTANAGTWDSGVALSYQWLIDFVEIPGATSATYSPIDEQVGGNISVRVTGTKQGYATEAANSDNNLTVKGAKVTTKTYAFGGLKGDSWWITAAMKSAVRSASKANIKAQTLVCVGIVKAGGSKSWMKTLGLKRAAVGCALAKLANPKLKVSYKAVIAKPNAKIQRGFTLTFTTK